jgi:hypothetical protein
MRDLTEEEARIQKTEDRRQKTEDGRRKTREYHAVTL